MELALSFCDGYLIRSDCHQLSAFGNCDEAHSISEFRVDETVHSSGWSSL